MMRLSRVRAGSLGWIAAGLSGLVLAGSALRADDPKADPAVERAREQIQMLDTLYKNAIVSVNNRFDGPPAIKMALDVFAAMEKGKWHRAKLVDASGSPQNEANTPKTSFEKRAVKVIQAGKPYYDEVSGTGKDRILSAATVVPAVTAKCAKCHGATEGDLLGFVRYELPIK